MSEIVFDKHKKTTISMGHEEYAALKVLAAQNGQSVSAFLRDLIDAALKTAKSS